MRFLKSSIKNRLVFIISLGIIFFIANGLYVILDMRESQKAHIEHKLQILADEKMIQIDDFIDNKLSINETLSFVKKQIPTVLNLHELWFMYDFFQLHKIELNDLVYLENINPYIYKLNSKTKNKEIIFYKLEDGVNAFTSVSSYLLNKDINKDSFLKENTSGSKSYNKLYKTVLKKIRKRDFGLKKHSNLYKIFNAFGYDLSIFK